MTLLKKLSFEFSIQPISRFYLKIEKKLSLLDRLFYKVLENEIQCGIPPVSVLNELDFNMYIVHQYRGVMKLE